MNKKKLAIVGIVGVPANYGGFETLTDNLLDLLPKFYDITVFCENKAYCEKPETYKGAKLEYLKLKANGAQSIIYDSVSLFKSCRKFDYIILLLRYIFFNFNFLKFLKILKMHFLHSL